jgi:aryl-alcohol dehydrogenase-like predicted oxidoreductase
MGENEAEAFALMDRAVDAGINFFDTANAYGGGRSESCIGKWLRSKGSAVREQLLVSSKVFNPVGPGPNDRGLSRRHILQQVDESLARLQTDRLDLYLIHEPDPETPLEETLAALHDLVRAGKVLYVGASNIEAWRLARALWISEVRKLARFEWVQNSYSLLDRTPEREMFPLCSECGVGFTAFSPLAGGWLTGKYRRDEAPPTGSRMTMRPEPYGHLEDERVYAGLDELGQMAADRGVSTAGLALAWALGGADSIVVGPRRPEQLEPVHEALLLELSPAERKEVGSLFS